MDIKNAPVVPQATDTDSVKDVSRRRFFQLAGGVAGAGLFIASCSKGPATDTYAGADDVGLLNYFLIIAQLQAAFYTQAVATPYYGLSVSESQLLTDVRDQEIAHREFLKSLLGTNAVPALSLNLSSVTFADRDSVIRQAILFEDLSVSAYNGAITLFQDTSYLTTLTKIASVEARHAAYFRDLNVYNSFANATVVDSSGFDLSASPAVVIEVLKTYSYTLLDTRRIPTY